MLARLMKEDMWGLGSESGSMHGYTYIEILLVILIFNTTIGLDKNVQAS